MTHDPKRQTGRPKRNHSRNSGAITVEVAMVLPLLVSLILGMVDVGQYINISQRLSNASREGARLAAKNGTSQVSEVQTCVFAYLSNSFPKISDTALEQALTVTVVDSNGSPISDGDLTQVAAGSPLIVQVSFPFSVVRWVDFLPLLNNHPLEFETTMRRE